MEDTKHSTSSVPKVYAKNYCTYCRKPPTTGNKFRSCTSCQAVVYCSNECQKQHWKLHKPFCLVNAETNRISQEEAKATGGKPKSANDTRHLTAFTSLHRQSLLQAIYGAICASQPDDKVDNFDFDGHYILFQLRRRYRPGSHSGGDPSKYFRIVQGGLRPREELDILLNEQSTANSTFWGDFPKHMADLDQHHRNMSLTDHTDCIGVIPCYFVIEGSGEHLIIGYMLLHEYLLKYVRGNNWELPERRHDRWLEWLQEKVELGHVFHHMKGLENKAIMDFGKMVKTKGKWTWVAFTDEEIEQYGYHRLYSGIVY